LLPDGGTPRRFDGDENLPQERLRVVMQARTLAEVHDAMNSPVSVAVAMLNTTFKRGNPWINEFYSVPKAQAGAYSIMMRTPIDEHYTDGTEDEGQSGELIVPEGRTLSPEEQEIANLLVGEGRRVEALVESTTTGDRTADFIVDGVRTELKTVSNMTTSDLSGRLSSRIMDGRGQATHIIIDARNQAGMTQELAERGVRRAYGRDNQLGGTIMQIRVIGNGFDITVPRQ
jgi:hypothetical protein